ncbi:MAG: glycerol dehydrogenase [Ardenticatenaceae bacterium]|nr:glycerol dehydrogenase [Ardenticatenaceae bacterium]MCB8947092.1 glycerol dehydrogenase [Ardenticatenaceae bacterium]
MISTTIFPGRYIQGYEATKRLGKEAARFGDTAFLIVDPFVNESLLPRFQADVEKEVSIVVESFNSECSDEEIARLGELVKAAGAKVIVGIGGGKALDTAKGTAHSLGLPVIIVPTIASTDAPTSALSVIYTPEGVFKRYLILPKNPDVVLVDTRIVAEAPVRFLVAGIGDALSTWFEADACERSYAGNMTGDVGSMTARRLARFCYETILEYGTAAVASCQAKAVTPALERVIEANTLLSGLGFESGGLSSCHAVHNGLTALEQTHHYWHGEKVAIGVVTSLFLTDKPAALIDEVYTFCEAVGLPTTLAEIGLENVTDEELMVVANRACAEGETIYNESIPVTPQTVFAALKAANAEGLRRKAG